MADKKRIDINEFENQAGMKEVKPGKFPLWGFLVAFIIVAGLFGMVRANRNLTSCPWEIDAVFALRALGNVELAYRDINMDNRYATLDGLKQAGFVKYGYVETQIVPHYRVSIEPTSDINDQNHTFSIRIYPLTRTRPCRTFRMGPERKIMEFYPAVNSDPHRKENWIESKDIEHLLPPRERLEWMGENYYYN